MEVAVMAEQRLIDANKVIGAMQKCLDECSEEEKQSVAYFAFESIITALKQEPTVDAVEVVRCKDCKHYKRLDDGKSKEWGICRRINVPCTYPNNYCSYGERRSDD
jgi:hypothetical protein